MPPKVKITKDEIVEAAVSIVRIAGADALNARSIAAMLHCSTQPIFSNFDSMEDLRFAVVEKADRLCQEYMHKEQENGKYPPYKAAGMAYIRFAKEEKELFKLLYMRDRAMESYPADLVAAPDIEGMVSTNTGLHGQDAQFFHLEMWAYVHGIATMFATAFFDLDWDLVSKMLTDSYLGLKKIHVKE